MFCVLVCHVHCAMSYVSNLLDSFMQTLLASLGKRQTEKRNVATFQNLRGPPARTGRRATGTTAGPERPRWWKPRPPPTPKSHSSGGKSRSSQSRWKLSKVTVSTQLQTEICWNLTVKILNFGTPWCPNGDNLCHCYFWHWIYHLVKAWHNSNRLHRSLA